MVKAARFKAAASYGSTSSMTIRFAIADVPLGGMAPATETFRADLSISIRSLRLCSRSWLQSGESDHRRQVLVYGHIQRIVAIVDAADFPSQRPAR